MLTDGTRCRRVCKLANITRFAGETGARTVTLACLRVPQASILASEKGGLAGDSILASRACKSSITVHTQAVLLIDGAAVRAGRSTRRVWTIVAFNTSPRTLASSAFASRFVKSAAFRA